MRVCARFRELLVRRLEVPGIGVEPLEDDESAAMVACLRFAPMVSEGAVCVMIGISDIVNGGIMATDVSE